MRGILNRRKWEEEEGKKSSRKKKKRRKTNWFTRRMEKRLTTGRGREKKRCIWGH